MVAAVISLTSGTTERPIGIVLDHEQVLLQAIFDLSQKFGTSLLNPLPLWFAGSRNHTFGALLKGSAVCFHPMLFSAQELTEAILATKATSVCAVPTIIRSMLEIAGERASPLFEALDALYCSGLLCFQRKSLGPRRFCVAISPKGMAPVSAVA